MRELVKEFVQIVSEIIPIKEPIVEFGSLQVQGQEGYADLRPFFQGKKYIGADIQKGPGVDCILNLHEIDLPSESVGTVLIMETLEHVEFPRKAILEINRILKPDGVLVISSVMNFPIHNYPHDYWRFTPQGFKSLLQIFPCFIVDFAGNEKFPHTIIGVGLKGTIKADLMEMLLNRIEIWKEHWNEGQAKYSRWKRLITFFVPPIVLKSYGALRYKIHITRSCVKSKEKE